MLTTNRPAPAVPYAPPANDIPPALQIAGLSVRYGNRSVLEGLDLEVGRGEVFGLLGPNGAGKTTLIRAICGRLRIGAGDILLCGQSNSRRTALRLIGLVPQEVALYPHLTARENLMTFGRLSGLSHAETVEACDFAIEATRLSDRTEERVDTFSGGWKRRVNIAAALLHKPQLLILDEPTVGVDVDARNALHGVIRDLSLSGLAVLLATHDLDQAQTLCHRVGFLRDGSIAQCGNPAVLLRQTFGTKSELLVELLEPASEGTCDMLRRLRFCEHASGMEWSRMINASVQKQAELTDALRRTDLRIREIRFREPGLASLFQQLHATGQPS